MASNTFFFPRPKARFFFVYKTMEALSGWEPSDNYQVRLSNAMKRGDVTIHSQRATHVYPFGPRPGFACLDITGVVNRSGIKLQTFALLSGDAKSCLVLLNGPKRQHALLVAQFRLPYGGYLIEACAGIVNNGNFKMVDELEEELDFDTEGEELKYVGQCVPSGGRATEVVDMYVLEKTLSGDEIAAIAKKCGRANVVVKDGVKTLEVDMDSLPAKALGLPKEREATYPILLPSEDILKLSDPKAVMAYVRHMQ